MDSVNDTQRTYAALTIIILSVVIVFIAARGFSSSIRSLSSGKTSDEPLTRDQNEIAVDQLRNQDTDGDGLSDFDELNLYTTSPYLADSDSDGLSDKEEVDAGKDPNCPGGKDCYGAVINEREGTTVTSSAPPTLQFDSASAQALKEVLPANPTADDIRALLRSQGATEAELNSISDAVLLENYRRAYNAL